MRLGSFEFELKKEFSLSLSFENYLLDQLAIWHGEAISKVSVWLDQLYFSAKFLFLSIMLNACKLIRSF